MTPDIELLSLLSAEREARADLGGVLDVHRALVAARADELPSLPPDVVRRGRARLARGETAYPAGEIAFDWTAVWRLAHAVCAVATRHQTAMSAVFARILSRLDALAPEGARQVIDTWLAHRIADADHRDGAALTFVLSHALRPTLHAHATAVLGDEHIAAWSRGQCPTCDGVPDFAALEPDSGGRRLLCARCDTEWSYARVGCPFCGASGDVGYHPAGGGAYRLYVCEGCRRYLKTVDRRETWQRRPLVLERILTVGLDVAATGAGYRATG